mmetsp:Transcript_21958/g.61395  ORF Transcript_21958/g.61395 Transcript_21958/m.61395 type:complete len:213 (+) Transcript_21958:315-953(+)
MADHMRDADKGDVALETISRIQAFLEERVFNERVIPLCHVYIKKHNGVFQWIWVLVELYLVEQGGQTLLDIRPVAQLVEAVHKPIIRLIGDVVLEHAADRFLVEALLNVDIRSVVPETLCDAHKRVLGLHQHFLRGLSHFPINTHAVDSAGELVSRGEIRFRAVFFRLRPLEANAAPDGFQGQCLRQVVLRWVAANPAHLGVALGAFDRRYR